MRTTTSTTTTALTAAIVGLSASFASAQTLSNSSRAVVANNSTTVTTVTGDWQWTTGVGATMATQNSSLLPGSIAGHAEGHAVWPVPNNADSSLITTVTLPVSQLCQINGTILTLVQSATGTGPGTAFLQIRNIDNAVVYAVGALPPFNQPHQFGAEFPLPAGQYIIEMHASAIAGGSSVINGVNAHSVLDFAISFQALCGAVAQNCFSPHDGGFCDDATCCNAVCTIDPSCCDQAWDSACVATAVSQCVSPLDTNEVICPWNGHRYAAIRSGSWNAVRLEAQTNGLPLVTIDDAMENRWLADRFVTWFSGGAWIGLNDLGAEGTWRWTSEAPVTFTAWNPGEPNGGTAENCVELQVSGGWNDLPESVSGEGIAERSRAVCGAGGSCFDTHGPGCADESCCNVVCILDSYCCDTEWDEPCVDEAHSSCAPSVVAGPYIHPVTKHRYFLLSSAVWPEAEKKAMQLGGHLVTIDSAAENEWVRLNLGNAAIGPVSFYAGANDQMFENVFVWQTGFDFPYQHWNPGEPNNYGGNEDFLIVGSNGGWNDVPLSIPAYSVVETPCVGDLNGDGVVGGADLGDLLGSWGSRLAHADLTMDGIVDAADLSVLLGAWGPCPSSSACSPHLAPGSDLPACTSCVCGMDPFCCTAHWDEICVQEAGAQCQTPCQCN